LILRFSPIFEITGRDAISGALVGLGDVVFKLFLPGAKFEGENHVSLDGKQLSASEVVHAAARVGAAFVTVSAVPFDLNGLVAELVGDDEDLSEAVKQVVARAEPHDGSTEGVSITRVAQGLAYVWHAQTEWTDSFLSELYAAQSESEAGEDAEHQESLERERRHIADAVAALIDSPEYRAESRNKRAFSLRAFLPTRASAT
jgi:hypothetical protein